MVQTTSHKATRHTLPQGSQAGCEACGIPQRGPLSNKYQSGREYTPLRGARVAAGPRKRVAPRGQGRNRTEKVLHYEASRSQLELENTSPRRPRVPTPVTSPPGPSTPPQSLREPPPRPWWAPRTPQPPSPQAGGEAPAHSPPELLSPLPQMPPGEPPGHTPRAQGCNLGHLSPRAPGP